MASIAAAQLLAPSNAVIRVLLPDNGGFLTVAWHNDKDIPDGKVPVARDLMKKVLAGYSKRVLGLTTLETEFEKRAALDFRPRRATDNKHDNHQKTLLNLYRFVVVKGKKKVSLDGVIKPVYDDEGIFIEQGVKHYVELASYIYFQLINRCYLPLIYLSIFY